MKNLFLFLLLSLLFSCSNVEDDSFDGLYEYKGFVFSYSEQKGVISDPDEVLAHGEAVKDVVVNKFKYTSTSLTTSTKDFISTTQTDEYGQFIFQNEEGNEYHFDPDLSLTKYGGHSSSNWDYNRSFVVWETSPTKFVFKSNDVNKVLNKDSIIYDFDRKNFFDDYGLLLTGDFGFKTHVFEEEILEFDCAIKVNMALEYQYGVDGEVQYYNVYRDENIDEYEVWVD